MIKFLLLFLLLPVTATTALASNIRPVLASLSLAHRSAVSAGIHIDIASKEKGLGAFATSTISFGSYVGTYVGEIQTRDEVRARYWGRQKPNADDLKWAASRKARGQGITGDYVMEMKDGHGGTFFVDAEDADVAKWTRFMNHAVEDTAECNLKAFDKLTEDGEMLTFPQFYAIRDIKAGEELLYDYGPHFFKNQDG